MFIGRGYTKYLLLCVLVALYLGGCTNAKLFPLPIQYPTITLQIQNYCPDTNPVVYNFKDVFVYNQQAYFNGFEYTMDTDGDGLPDSFESVASNAAYWGISYLYFDTNQNGFSDLVKVRSGIPATSESSMPVCYSGYTDTDLDGLTDCEELLIGTTTSLSDTDGDGIPDGIEYRFGMNPLDANDAATQLMGDGYTNYQKVRLGVNISVAVTSQGKQLLPVYNIGPMKNPVGTSCANPLTFTVSNISILPVATGNVIQVKTIEDPQTAVFGGKNYARQSQVLTIVVPSSIQNKSTILYTTGVDGQTVTNPTIIPPAGGS